MNKRFSTCGNMISIFKKNAHTCDNLDFHHVYNEKGIPFLLKIKIVVLR